MISWRNIRSCSSLIPSLQAAVEHTESPDSPRSRRFQSLPWGPLFFCVNLKASFSMQQSNAAIPFAREQKPDLARSIGASLKGRNTLRWTETSHGYPGDAGDAAALRKVKVVLSWIVFGTPTVMSFGNQLANASLLYLATFPHEMIGCTSKIETVPLPSKIDNL